MTRRSRLAGSVAAAAMVANFLLPAIVEAQQASKSAPLARELTQLLEQKKIDSIAGKDPARTDHYVAALYFPGLQLLVVSARYAVPMYINERFAKKEYREIYIDLNSASVAGSKVFIEDLKADGLAAERDGDQPFDIYEAGNKRTMFDGDFKKQKMTEEEYRSAFTAADEDYARNLALLIAEAKK